MSSRRVSKRTRPDFSKAMTIWGNLGLLKTVTGST